MHMIEMKNVSLNFLSNTLVIFSEIHFHVTLLSRVLFSFLLSCFACSPNRANWRHDLAILTTLNHKLKLAKYILKSHSSYKPKKIKKQRWLRLKTCSTISFFSFIFFGCQSFFSLFFCWCYSTILVKSNQFNFFSFFELETAFKIRQRHASHMML